MKTRNLNLMDIREILLQMRAQRSVAANPRCTFSRELTTSTGSKPVKAERILSASGN